MFPPKKKPGFPGKGAMPGKKPGLDVMIAVGKKPGGDLGSPSPVEGMMPRHMADAKPGKPPDTQHEAAESPEYEQNEEYGAKLIQDLESAGEQYGLDAKTTHEVAAAFFEAMANCLRGDSGGDEESGEAAPDDEYGAGE